MIYIVTGRSRYIGNFYDTIINPIKGYLNDNNIDYKTVHFADQVKKNKKDLFIGIFHHIDIRKIPKNYIMLAMDPPSNCDENIKTKLKNAKAVLYYINKYYFIKLNKNLIQYPFPYHKSIENMYNIEKNSISKIRDIITIGSVNDKRKKLYNYLKNRNYDIYFPNIETHPRGIYEKEQDQLLYSSKIVLLHNYYKNDIDLPRMIYNSSNKIFFIYVIDEEDDENLLEGIYDDLIIKCNLDNLEETINYYLTNEDKRKENTEKLYEYVTNKNHVKNFLTKDIFNTFQ